MPFPSFLEPVDIGKRRENCVDCEDRRRNQLRLVSVVVLPFGQHCGFEVEKLVRPIHSWSIREFLFDLRVDELVGHRIHEFGQDVTEFWDARHLLDDPELIKEWEKED